MNKVVFDVGGTAIKYALMDNDANILQKDEIATPYTENGQADFIDTLVALFGLFADQADGVAISLPGNIDSNTGYVYTAGALDYNKETHLGKLLAEALKEAYGRDIPVAIENDGKSAALAEVWKGNLNDVNNGVVIIIGTGIGGGIIIDRKVLKGKDFFAGELSFLKTDLDNDDFASVLARTASTSALVGKVEKAHGLEHHSINGFDVFNMINDEDEHALRAFDEVTTHLASTIQNLVATLNPERVLIGGGISKQPLVVATIRDKFNDKVQALHEFGLGFPTVEIDVTKHFNDSNLIGALYNYSLLYPETME